MNEPDVDQLRANLDEKLAELKRRAVHAKEVVAPLHYLASPWTHVGIAAVLGFMIGSFSRSTRNISG
jgi:hypothetical protein